MILINKEVMMNEVYKMVTSSLVCLLLCSCFICCRSTPTTGSRSLEQSRIELAEIRARQELAREISFHLENAVTDIERDLANTSDSITAIRFAVTDYRALTRELIDKLQRIETEKSNPK